MGESTISCVLFGDSFVSLWFMPDNAELSQPLSAEGPDPVQDKQAHNSNMSCQ